MLLELIARINPKQVNLMSAGGGRSENVLTPEDIAQALAGIKDPLGSVVARVKFAGHDPASLYATFAAHVKWEAARLGWKKSRDPQILDKFSRVVVDEFLDCRCTRCEGRGTVRRILSGLIEKAKVDPSIRDMKGTVETGIGGPFLVVACDACGGEGNGELSQAERSRRMGFADPKSYRETWHERFEAMSMRLAHAEVAIEEALRQKLRRR